MLLMCDVICISAHFQPLRVLHGFRDVSTCTVNRMWWTPGLNLSLQPAMQLDPQRLLWKGVHVATSSQAECCGKWLAPCFEFEFRSSPLGAQSWLTLRWFSVFTPVNVGIAGCLKIRRRRTFKSPSKFIFLVCATHHTHIRTHTHHTHIHIQGYPKRSIHFQKFILQVLWTYGDVLYTGWRENSQSYVHTLQALNVRPTCEVADVKLIIQLFRHCT
jgi:hypothetical protein